VSEKRIRVALIGVDLFEAASAIIGAVGLVVGFMAIPISVLSTTPFVDFTVPALLLGVVVGGSALAAGIVTLLEIRRWDALASAAAGCITLGWLTIEIAMIGLATPAQVVWWLVGLLMVVLAVLLWHAEREPVARDVLHAVPR
jgi:hypothetical protein